MSNPKNKNPKLIRDENNKLVYEDSLWTEKSLVKSSEISEDLTNSLLKLNSKFNNVNNKVSNLVLLVSKNSKTLTNVLEQIPKITSDINLLKTKTDNVDFVLSNIKEQNKINTTSIVNLQTDVSTLQVDVSNNNTDITTLETNINNLESQVNSEDFLFIKGKTEEGGDINKRFSTLEFNNDSGFNLTKDEVDNSVTVSLGSHFKTIIINDSESVVAEGQDTLELFFGDSINVQSNSVDKSITLDINEGFLINSSNIFFTNIEAQSTQEAVNLQLSNDGYKINSFTTTTLDIIVTIEFEGGQEEYRGNYTINDIPITNYIRKQGRWFEGTVNVTLSEFTGQLIAEGNNSVQEIPHSQITGGEVTKAEIVDIKDKGLNQVDIKYQDEVFLLVEADKSFTEVIVSSGDFYTNTTSINPSTTSTTISIRVNNSNNTIKQSEGFIKVRDIDGALSPDFSIQNSLTIDNITPELSIDSINPLIALKENDNLIITFSPSNNDYYNFISTELKSITESSNSIEVTLSTEGINKEYRDTGNNFNIEVVKESNNSTLQKSGLVKIATVPVAINNISNNKLRSTESVVTQHAIDINFTQEVKSLTLNNSIEAGNFVQINSTANPKNWKVIIEIDENIIHKQEFYSLDVESINYSNISSINTVNYFIKGFTKVTKQIDTNTTLDVVLNVDIVDTSKLIVTSTSPPLTYTVVSNFSGDPDEIKVNRNIITFSEDIKSFLTGNNPPGNLVVDIEELN